MTRARPRPVHSARTLTVIWQSASLLLDYPDQALMENVPMLRAAGVAVAMDNAHPEVKKVAQWVAPSNNDHGVHAALVKYGLCG